MGTRRRRPGGRSAQGLLAQAEPVVWLLGGALAICMAMIAGLLGLVIYQGLSTFWPLPIERFELTDGRVLMGEVTRIDRYTPRDEELANAGAPEELAETKVRRRLVRTANFDLTNEHFNWVSDFLIERESAPEWAIVVERLEWGLLYGTPVELRIDGSAVATGPAETWEAFQEHHDDVRERWRERRKLESHDIGVISARQERARLAVVATELEAGEGSARAQRAQERYERVQEASARELATIRERINELNELNSRYVMVVEISDGRRVELPLAEAVRAFPTNRLGFTEKLKVYFARWWEFLSDEPREANQAGGVWPAIFGTVIMTLLMSIAVVPFGVLAALYLHEYAKAGAMISTVRIAVNNLAGVPSIVFGVFGLGFFCYGIGGYIDTGPASPWGVTAWWATLAITLVSGAAGVMLWLNSSDAGGTGSRLARGVAVVLWGAALVGVVLALAKTPYFDGFFAAKAPNPTFGTGGVLWASLTLALLTLPVVIVATEEALAAVPNSMREGSFACGATKWQTIRRIVLPRAMPGIITGMILAMARGAGEVAPLMLVGAVKLAHELPVDGIYPYIHAERSFMHLGFHIYDLGFQSQNSEAAKPMVYTTTLLLVTIVVGMNATGMLVRARLRKRFRGGQF